MRISHSVILAFLLALLLGCSEKHPTMHLAEYLKWLNNEDSQLVKRKYVNGMEITVKFLPPDFLTYREIQNDPEARKYRDSLLAVYSKSLTFLMSLGPDEREVPGPDVMLSGIADYKAYSKRVITMNFEMEKYVSLQVNGVEYRPVLSAMENIYGLNSKRNIIFVFVPAGESDTHLFEADKIDFVYEDELFGLGFNHFIFNRSHMENRPQIAMN